MLSRTGWEDPSNLLFTASDRGLFPIQRCPAKPIEAGSDESPTDPNKNQSADGRGDSNTGSVHGMVVHDIGGCICRS